MQNYILYPTPFIPIKMPDKERAAIDTIFCPIKKGQCWTPKIPKILTFLHWATETSRLTWHNQFGHRSTQSAISNQNDQNAPGQPSLTKSQSWSKSFYDNIFHVFTSNLSHLEIFVNFDQVLLEIDS